MMKKVKVNFKPPFAKETSRDIMWAFVYLLLVLIILISSCFIFKKVYYTPFFVKGNSMRPTLNTVIKDVNLQPMQDIQEFGLFDDHIDYYHGHQNSSRHELKRYDIAISYYPENFTIDKYCFEDFTREEMLNNYLKPNSDSKIKRIIGLPGETIKIEMGEVEYNEKKARGYIISVKAADFEGVNENEFEVLDLPFVPLIEPDLVLAIKDRNNHEIFYDELTWHLGDDEFFLMGDHWGGSTDSIQKGPIHFNCITGVAISITGYFIIDSRSQERLSRHYYTVPRHYKR